MNTRKIIWCILLTVFCFYLLSACNDDSITKEEFRKTWQQYIVEETKIKDLVIPGTHNSATKDMIFVAECQEDNIIDQLNAGVRYFDFRATLDDGAAVPVHGYVTSSSYTYEEIFNEINTFITDSKEVLILDFSVLEKGVETTLQALLLAIIDSSKILPVTYNLDNVTIKDMKNNGYNIIIIWDSSERDETYFFNRESYENLTSPYTESYNTGTAEEVIANLGNYYTEYNGKGLFVLQMIITPDSISTLNIKENETKLIPVANEYLSNLPNENLLKTNIIIRDLITYDETTIDVILSLNSTKGIVADGFEKLFVI